MKITNRNKTTKTRLIAVVIVLTSLLVAGVGIVLLLNIEKSKDTVIDKQAQPNQTIEEKQKDTQSGENPQAQTITGSKIVIVLSAASQDVSNGPIVIRSILEGANGGSCKYTLAKSGITKTYSSNVAFSGTYYSCNYDIPFSDLSSGLWTVTLSATQGSSSGSVSQEVTVK